MKKNILKATACFLLVAVCLVVSYFFIRGMISDDLEIKDKIVEEL